jgi:DNA-3-methyladenine glycosylase II
MIHNGRQKLPYDAAEAVKSLKAADKKLAVLMERAGDFTLKLGHSGTPFDSLLESILYQQLHGKAAATIHGRVRALYGDGDPTPEELLRTPEEQLRGCGVSGNKIRALRDLAERSLDGTVPTLAAIRRMPDDEIVKRLTTVRGIGPWTVEMLLIFRLGRPNVFPVTDYGVRKGFLLTFGKAPKSRPVATADLPTAEAMQRRAKKWQPWRSVASWYLWRACDLEAAARKAVTENKS